MHHETKIGKFFPPKIRGTIYVISTTVLKFMLNLREEGTGEAYFFIFQGTFFLFKYIQICRKTTSVGPILEIL